MAKRKSIEEALAAWEDARLDDDYEEEDSEAWEDDGIRDDNVCIDEEGE